jgi:acetyltransferase-like isoleucine patch superfamily enzyme
MLRAVSPSGTAEAPVGVFLAPSPARGVLGRAAGWARLTLARVRGRGRVRVEGRAYLGRGVRLAVAPGARLVLGAGCTLGEGVRVGVAGGEVRIGAGARIGERATLVALAGIVLGERCEIGPYALVADAGPGVADVERPIRLQPVRAAPIEVGAGARAGAHAALLAGARVGAAAVLGSYAVVADEVAPGAVVEPGARHPGP